MEVKIIEKDSEWNEIISKLEKSTVYHTVEWKKLLEKHGCKGFLIVAEENDSVRGILPLYLTRNRLNERQFVSIPFAGYKDILIAQNSKDILKGLIEGWKLLVEKYKPLKTLFRTDLILKEKGKVTPFVDYSFKNNDYTTDMVLYKVFSKLTRKDINNSINRGNKIVEEHGNDILDDYYEMFQNRIVKRNVIFPRYSKKFFRDVFSILEKYLNIFTVVNKEKIVAASIRFFYNNKIFCWSAFSHNEALKLRSNTLLYWWPIKLAVENRYKMVHFGGHPVGNDLGLHSIKSKFSNNKEISYLWKINHSFKADLEDLVYSTATSFKNLILTNNQG